MELPDTLAAAGTSGEGRARGAAFLQGVGG